VTSIRHGVRRSIGLTGKGDNVCRTRKICRMRCKDSRSGRRFVFNQVEVELLRSNPFSQAPSKEFVVKIKNDERSEKRREGLAASDTGFAFEAEEFACIHAPAALPPLSE